MAQKLFAEVCPGDARVAGKKPAGAEDGEKASQTLLDAVKEEAKARREDPVRECLLPMDGKDLLQAVQQEMGGRLAKYEEKDFDHAKATLGRFRDKRYKDVEPIGDEPDPLSYKVGDDVVTYRKANKWNNAARQAQLKARYASGYIDSLLLGTPCQRQVIAQPMTAEPPPPPSLPYKVDTSRPSLRSNWTRLVPFPQVIAQPMTADQFEERRVKAVARMEADAEAKRRAERRGGAPPAEKKEKDDKKDKKDKKGGGKGQQGSGKADAIKAEADKKRLEKTTQAKRDQLEHVKKNAPKELKTDVASPPTHTSY